VYIICNKNTLIIVGKIYKKGAVHNTGLGVASFSTFLQNEVVM
jgi:hypothetical protein